MAPRRSVDEQTVAGVGLVGLLAIQIIIGYEWLVSGITKLWRGGFATGLANELRTKSQGTTRWYRSFLDDAVIPHGWAVGSIVLVAEILVGVVLALLRWTQTGQFCSAPQRRSGVRIRQCDLSRSERFAYFGPRLRSEAAALAQCNSASRRQTRR